MCYVVLRVLIALLGTTALVKHCQRTLARGAALLHDGYGSELQLNGPLK